MCFSTMPGRCTTLYASAESVINTALVLASKSLLQTSSQASLVKGGTRGSPLETVTPRGFNHKEAKLPWVNRLPAPVPV